MRIYAIRRVVLFLSILLCIDSAADSQAGSPCLPNNWVCGCIQVKYNTVPAYYNGSDTDSVKGCAGTGPYKSIQYQCPEYIVRFYAPYIDTSSDSWLNYWEKAGGADFFYNAGSLGLLSNPNCINGAAPGQPQTGCVLNSSPQADDILSFCRLDQTTNQCVPTPANATDGETSDPGHVAIIIGNPTITGTTFTIPLIEENWSKDVDSKGNPYTPTLSGKINQDGTYTIFDREGACHPDLHYLHTFESWDGCDCSELPHSQTSFPSTA